jgi:hypothetical protein
MEFLWAVKIVCDEEMTDLDSLSLSDTLLALVLEGAASFKDWKKCGRWWPKQPISMVMRLAFKPRLARSDKTS